MANSNINVMHVAKIFWEEKELFPLNYGIRTLKENKPTSNYPNKMNVVKNNSKKT